MVDLDIEKAMRELPVIPDVAMKIVGMAEESMDLSFGQLEDLIKLDPILSAKILKVANSALYARQREITSLKMAISLIGFKTIKSLVLLISAANLFPKYRKTQFYKMFWRHSLYSAFTSKRLTLLNSTKDWAEQLFLTGLFHDIGQIALYNTDPAGYERILKRRQEENLRIRMLEQEYFGTTHTEVGAEVLTRWNFPPLFVEVALFHGKDVVTSANRKWIAIVSMSDILANEFEGFPLPSEKESVLRELSQTIALRMEDLEALRKDFLKTLKEDPLYRECEQLFQLG